METGRAPGTRPRTFRFASILPQGPEARQGSPHPRAPWLSLVGAVGYFAVGYFAVGYLPNSDIDPLQNLKQICAMAIAHQQFDAAK